MENKLIVSKAKEAEVVEYSQFNIQESKAKEITKGLELILSERQAFESQYNDVVTMNIESPQTWKLARELRLRIRDNRTKGIEQWHKAEKEFFLRGGQFVDAIKKKELVVSHKMESDLAEIENYAEIKEAERKDALEASRKQALEPVINYAPSGINLREMSDDDFDRVLKGAFLMLDAEIKAKEEAEKEKARLEGIERTRWKRSEELRPYNDFFGSEMEGVKLGEIDETEYSAIKSLLASKKKAHDDAIAAKKAEEAKRLKEAEEKAARAAERSKQMAPFLAFINDYDHVFGMSDNDFLKELKSLEAQLAEQKLYEEKKRREEAAIKAKEEADRIEAMKVAAQQAADKEIARKQAAEKLAKEEAEKKEKEKLAKAPIKKQMKVWVDSFSIPSPSTVNETSEAIQEKFESFKKWSLTQIENL